MGKLICWMVPWDLSLMTLGRARSIMLAMTALIPVVVWLLYDIAWRVMPRVVEALQSQSATWSLQKHGWKGAGNRGACPPLSAPLA